MDLELPASDPAGRGELGFDAGERRGQRCSVEAWVVDDDERFRLTQLARSSSTRLSLRLIERDLTVSSAAKPVKR